MKVKINFFLTPLQKIPNHDPTLLEIPQLESLVSSKLRGMKIVRRDNQPITNAQEYIERLYELKKMIDGFRMRSQFPTSWPMSMMDFEMCVEPGACDMFLSPSGQFIVPSNVPDFLFVEYITQHLGEALERVSIIVMTLELWCFSTSISERKAVIIQLLS